MNTVFWIGLGFIACGSLLGAATGLRAQGQSAVVGGLTGAYLGLMLGFPLLAIGLANS